ncbi:MAG: hypothetical protein L6282_09745 [Candidatus Methanoperedenaceae archaeon]|nr:hypothetical protein [Candidatus Methanoperedenaceae archaeon]
MNGLHEMWEMPGFLKNNEPQMKAGKKLCLLINFSKPRVEIKRIVRGFGNN